MNKRKLKTILYVLATLCVLSTTYLLYALLDISSQVKPFAAVIHSFVIWMLGTVFLVFALVIETEPKENNLIFKKYKTFNFIRIIGIALLIPTIGLFYVFPKLSLILEFLFF